MNSDSIGKGSDLGKGWCGTRLIVEVITFPAKTSMAVAVPMTLLLDNVQWVGRFA
jgi:hypothetical protein